METDRASRHRKTHGLQSMKPEEQAWYFNDKYPWPGMLLCAPIIGLWYWCTDQYIVQRVLGAPNEKEARRGSMFAGFLKLTSRFSFYHSWYDLFCSWQKVGSIRSYSMIFDANGTCNKRTGTGCISIVGDACAAGWCKRYCGCRVACGIDECSCRSIQCLIFSLHDGLLFKLRPNASQAKLVRVGRVATVVMVIIGLLWIPVIQGARGLYDYLQGIQAYLAPPIFVVFFFGVFMKRLNGTGCLATLLTGFAMGLFRLS